MEMLLIIPAMLIASLLTYFLTRGYYRKLIRNMYIEKTTGKFGVYQYKMSYENAKIDVEEIVSAGPQTKVRIIKVYNNDSSKCSEFLQKMNAINHIAWIPTSDITWYDNTSQVMRDKKIKDIIGETDN